MVCNHEHTYRCLRGPQRPRSRSLREQLLIYADTRIYECQVHGTHRSCNEISVVYFVCSSCHHCIGSIRVLITGMWSCIGFDSFASGFRFWSNSLRFFGFGWFFYGFAVSNKPQCPPHIRTCFPFSFPDEWYYNPKPTRNYLLCGFKSTIPWFKWNPDLHCKWKLELCRSLVKETIFKNINADTGLFY